MQHEPDDDDISTLPRIQIPDYVPPTEEELKRRQEVIAKIHRLREKIGPIGIRADELKHQSRAEAEG
ncbi:MAG TPA: hypothetical protein VEX37_14600 [Thermomicrobiales bacterium]|nr:hypothetical protein [Thermomicrobiales bacterium]